MALNGTMVKIETVTVGSGGASSIVFNNIPQTYTDLKIVLSGRTDLSQDRSVPFIQFNSDTSSNTNYSYRRLYGIPTIATSSDSGAGAIGGYITANTATASTFGSLEFYVTNYTGSTAKSISSDGVSEQNSSPAGLAMTAGLWNQTAAITSVTIKPDTSGNFVQHTTATLYGISRTTSQIKATGGMVYDDENYVYHLFRSSGTFTPRQSLSADVLVVAGGAGSGTFYMGGGGAGGVIGFASQSLTNSTNYTVTIGAGGAAGDVIINSASYGNNGNDSQFGALTAAVGGGGGAAGDSVARQGRTGGSGGGGGGFAGGTGGAGTTNQGNAGGNGQSSSVKAAGGGGGAGSVGGNASGGVGGAGGSGTNNVINFGSITGFLTATGTGVNGFIAGGGGGGADASNSGTAGGAAGSGGGGAGKLGSFPTSANGDPGVANTGGGAGGGGQASAGANGGSGVVIIRYAK